MVRIEINFKQFAVLLTYKALFRSPMEKQFTLLRQNEGFYGSSIELVHPINKASAWSISIPEGKDCNFFRSLISGRYNLCISLLVTLKVALLFGTTGWRLRSFLSAKLKASSWLF